MELIPIASVENDFASCFGIPRQGGLHEAKSNIVFLPEFRDPDALRGLEGFSHIWLLWGFHKKLGQEGSGKWQPTVRPPRLGGKQRIGVFASRSPNRPNPVGLSALKIANILLDSPRGPILEVFGADILNGSPVYDIKPYLPYADCIPEAAAGAFHTAPAPRLEVVATAQVIASIPEKLWPQIEKILALDPRPAYQDDPERVYGISYGAYNIRFRVAEDVLTVVEISENL